MVLLAIVMVALWVLLTALFALAYKLGIDWIILRFAEKDIWWSPLRMKPSGGHIHFYTKGRVPTGDFATLLHGVIPYWWYHKKDRQFYKEGTQEFNEKFGGKAPRPRGNWAKRLNRLGVGWVGFFRRRYSRKRQWEAWDLIKSTVPGKEPQYGIVAKETKPGEEHIFYFATTMAFGFNFPTKDLGAASGTIVFNLLIVHPEKAEFIAGKFEVQGVAALRSRTRDHVTGKTFPHLLAERDTQGTKDLVDNLLRANDTQPGETATLALEPAYGIRAEGPRFEDFDLSEGEGGKSIADARRRLEVAKVDLKTENVKAKQAKVRGQGLGDARVAEAEGIKAEFAARTSVRGGAELSMAEAVRAQQQLRYLALGQGGGANIAVQDEPDPPPNPK